jgi:hypothetical protein
VTEHPVPYSRRARARLGLSLAASSLSDTAAALVPTSGDAIVPPGAFVGLVARLIWQAEAVLEHAVILDRERGASWDVIAHELAADRQRVQERFGPAERRWRESLLQNWKPAAEDPEQVALGLDRWAARRDGAGAEEAAHQASAGLLRATLAEQITMALAEQRFLSDHEPLPTGAPSAERAAWEARRLEVFDRLARLFGRLARAQPDNRTFGEAAASARRRVVELSR